MRTILKKIMYGEGHLAVLARGSVAGLGVQVVGALLGLAAQIALARTMNQPGYGTYSYVLTWIYTIGVVTVFGFDTGLVRFIAEYISGQQYGLLRSLHRFVLKFSFGAALAAGCVIIALVYLGVGHISPEMRWVFWIAVALLPVLTLIRINEAIMRGCKRVIWGNIGTSILRPAILTVMIGFMLLAGHRLLSPVQAMMLTFIAALAALVVISVKVQRTLSSFPTAKTIEFKTRQWLVISLPLLLIASIGTVLNRADILILGGLGTAAQVGVYNVVSKISGLLIFGLSAVNMIAAPMFAEIYARGDREQLQRIVALASVGIFIFVFAGVVVMTVFGRWMLGIFGAAYVQGYHALLILLVAQGINALCGPVGYLLSMTGRQTIAMKVLFVAAFINVLLNFALIPWLGYEGAALATATAMILWNVILLVIVRMDLKINPTIFGLFKIDGI
jgi:O-antigen/teichoic acid export membrane protein